MKKSVLIFCRKSFLTCFTVASLLTISWRCTPDETYFAKEEMKESWPFTGITSGSVSCTPDGAIIFTANDDNIYALNGWAKTLIKSKHPYWKNSADIQIVGKDIGPIIKIGQKNCQK